jgi:hypothetical protein
MTSGNVIFTLGRPKPSRIRAMLHVRCTAFWMQATGAALLAVEPRSLAHVPTTAQDGRSACGLLYPLLYGMSAANADTVKSVLIAALLSPASSINLL